MKPEEKQILYKPKRWALYCNNEFISSYPSHNSAKAALHRKCEEMKKYPYDYEPQRTYWEGFARLFDSSAIEYVKGQKEQNVVEVSGEYKKGFECGKQRVLKYPEEFNLQHVEQKPSENNVIIPQFHIGDYIKPKAYNEEHLILEVMACM